LHLLLPRLLHPLALTRCFFLSLLLPFSRPLFNLCATLLHCRSAALTGHKTDSTEQPFGDSGVLNEPAWTRLSWSSRGLCRSNGCSA
jgi:hypothetical protein